MPPTNCNFQYKQKPVPLPPHRGHNRQGRACMPRQVLHTELEDLVRLLEEYRASMAQRKAGALLAQPPVTHALVT